MNRLSPEQLNTLGKSALIVIVSALQDQLELLSSRLDSANKTLDENNHRINLLTEQIRIMNQRQFGRRSESSLQSDDGQLSFFDVFNEVEGTASPEAKEPEIQEIIIPEHKRKKSTGKREADLEGLPARIFEHTLSKEELDEYSVAAEPPVRCGVSHHSGLTEPPVYCY